MVKRMNVSTIAVIVIVILALIQFAIGAATPVFSGIVKLRIDSGDVVGDPSEFQFTIDGNAIGVKLHPGKKPWIYQMPWDSRTVPDGLHVLSGWLWFGIDRKVPLATKTIVEVRQPRGRMADAR